ncbi:MAG: archease [Bacillota bacterium]|jgi:SHS2 domain-containing protein
MADVKTIIEPFDEAGDAAFRVTASSLPEVFTGCGLALSNLILPRTELGAVPQSGLGAPATRRMRLAAPDLESLLVDFANEIIFLFDSEAFVPSGFEFHEMRQPEQAEGTGNARLEAEVTGIVLAEDALHSVTERCGILGLVPKAASYHMIEVAGLADGRWTARLVLDA